MTEPTSLTQRHRIALRRRAQRVARAFASPFARDGEMPFLEGEASPYSEELMDALYEHFYEGRAADVPKSRRDDVDWDTLPDRRRNDPDLDKKVRKKAEKYPVIPTRLARKKSQEDRSPHLRMHPSTKLDEYGQPALDREGNEKVWDPIEQAAFNAYLDEITEALPFSQDDDYTDDELLHIARSAVYRRERVDTGQVTPGGHAHVALMDCEVRAEDDDQLGRELSRLLYWQPPASTRVIRPRDRKEEAVLLGISERTWRRRRAAMREAAA